MTVSSRCKVYIISW